MKKIFTTLTALTFIIGLSSCGSSSGPRKSTAPLDYDLVGTWMSDQVGYNFGEDRKVSLLIDFSKRGHFTADGEFFTVNSVLPKESIEYDGTHIKVINTRDGQIEADSPEAVVLEMNRLDEANKDSMDGRYNIQGGALRSLIAKETKLSADTINVEGIIEGESFRINVINCLDYEAKNDKLYIFGDDLSYTDAKADAVTYNYSIDHDKLVMDIIGIEDAQAEVYFKVYEEDSDTDNESK